MVEGVPEEQFLHDEQTWLGGKAAEVHQVRMAQVAADLNLRHL